MSEVEALLRDGVLVMDDVFGACHAVELSDALQKLYEAGRLPRGEIGRSAAKQRSSPRRAARSDFAAFLGEDDACGSGSGSGIGEDEEIDVWGRHRKMVEALLLRLAKEAAEASSCSSSSS